MKDWVKRKIVKENGLVYNLASLGVYVKCPYTLIRVNQNYSLSWGLKI